MSWTTDRALLLAAATAAVCAVTGCTAPHRASPTAVPTSAPVVPRAGAPGIGDPYFPRYGNGGYDVSHYAIKIRYEPATDRLTGEVTVAATATAALTAFNLDFHAMTVRSVTVDDRAATHRRAGDELTVVPAGGVRRGGTFTTRVRYDGVPQPVSRSGLGSEGFLPTADGAVVLGEPESAATWFPVNDHPADKATYTIQVTAPQRLAAISNGVRTAVASAAGWTTSTWQVRAPMASYLATVVIGDYRVTVGTHGGAQLISAVSRSLPVGSADAALARTGEVADFLASQFGPYPFDAYGGVVVDDSRIRFALECQTRPVYAARFFAGGAGTAVIAHELAHQWYGDSVSVARWKDIWLNEGFATYAEWLWTQHQGGASPREQMRSWYRSAPDRDWRVAPADPGVGDLFSWAVYTRGAMALEALRIAVGDETFFRIIREWAAQRRNSNGSTEDFVALAERDAGRPLRGVFNPWLYAPTKPPM